jgi:hypothetical protein
MHSVLALSLFRIAVSSTTSRLWQWPVTVSEHASEYAVLFVRWNNASDYFVNAQLYDMEKQNIATVPADRNASTNPTAGCMA